MALPRVVFVGRVNVGKSTLFNRLSRAVKSITLNYEGVTRDPLFDTIEWQGKRFEIIDTAGFSRIQEKDPITLRARAAARARIADASCIVMVVDGTAPLLPEDLMVADEIRATGCPVIVALNKSDARSSFDEYAAASLGFEQVVPLSAEHGKAIGDLLSAIVDVLPKQQAPVDEKPAFKIMMLGKPNVGKSSLMNRLMGEERSIVSDVPGTTREALEGRVSFYNEDILVTDTPGVRRPRAVREQLESLMVRSAFDALDRSNIILLVIDAHDDPFADQERKLAFYAFTERYKAVMVILNKTDLLDDAGRKLLQERIDEYRHLTKKLPMIETSCLTGSNLGKIMPRVHELWQRYSQILPDSEVQRLCVSEMNKKPMMHGGNKLRLYSVRQRSTAPIVLEFVVNEPLWFDEAEKGFFENLLRARYDLVGVPLKCVFVKNAR